MFLVKVNPDATKKIPTPILITGAGGMLAWDLARRFQTVVGEEAVFCLDRTLLDITSPEKIREQFAKIQPKLVLNAAAYTKVDAAESERLTAHSVNALGPKNLVAACKTSDTSLVHFSTDQVFDGDKNVPWTEQDDPHPINYYGQSKLEGEHHIRGYKKGLLLRVQWLYGQKKDRFTSLRNREKFTPVMDQLGCPTWTRDVAQTVLELISRNVFGLFHFAYDDFASWVEVYELVKKELDISVELAPKKTADLNLPANRPHFSVLSNKKLTAALERNGMGSWRTSLVQFLKEAQS